MVEFLEWVVMAWVGFISFGGMVLCTWMIWLLVEDLLNDLRRRG